MKSLLGYGKPIASKENQLDGMFRQSPTKCPPVFDGHHLVVYAMLNDNAQIPETVTLIASSPVGPLSVKLQVNVKDETDEMIHRLAAKKLIQDLQDADAEARKKEIIDMGCRYGLASKYTSYVTVDSKARELGDSWMMMKSRDVPLDYYLCDDEDDDDDDEEDMGCGLIGQMSLGYSCSQTQVSCDASDSSDRSVCDASYWADEDNLDEDQYYDDSPISGTFDSNFDKLQEVISIQGFGGSFNMDEKLARLLNSTIEDVQSAVPNIFSSHSPELMPKINSIWATVLSLAYMELVLANRKDSWHLVAAKAEKWLNTLSWTNLDVAKEAAENYVKSKLQL